MLFPYIPAYLDMRCSDGQRQTTNRRSIWNSTPNIGLGPSIDDSALAAAIRAPHSCKAALGQVSRNPQDSPRGPMVSNYQHFSSQAKRTLLLDRTADMLLTSRIRGPLQYSCYSSVLRPTLPPAKSRTIADCDFIPSGQRLLIISTVSLLGSASNCWGLWHFLDTLIGKYLSIASFGES
jgi:hypothetical protein